MGASQCELHVWPASTYVLALLGRIRSSCGSGGPLGPGTAVCYVVEGLEHHGLLRLLLGADVPPAQWRRQAYERSQASGVSLCTVVAERHKQGPLGKCLRAAGGGFDGGLHCRLCGGAHRPQGQRIGGVIAPSLPVLITRAEGMEGRSSNSFITRMEGSIPACII